MELVSTIEINGEEREIADAYARGQIATNAQNIATNAEGIAGLNNNLSGLSNAVAEKIESEVATDFSQADTPEFQQTIDDIAGSVSGLRGDLDKVKDLTVREETVISTNNITNDIKWTDGYMGLDGKTYNNSNTLRYSSKIPVKVGDVLETTKNFRFVTAFSDETANSDLGTINVKSYTVPDGINYVVVTTYIGYDDTIYLIRTERSYKKPKMGYMRIYGNLNDGESLVLPYHNVKNHNVLAFSANVSSFGSLKIGKQSDTYVTVDDTNVSVTCDVEWGNYSVAHGLTIQKNIQVIIENETSIEPSIIRVLSCGNEFNITIPDGTRFLMDEGSPYVASINSTLTDCVFSWTSRNINKPIWLFGDSYFSWYVSRWVYYLAQDGFIDSCMLNGYAGENSKYAYQALENLLKVHTPDMVVWCLGMNEPDNADSVNESWKFYYDNVVNLSKKYGFELILYTTPTTPTMNNRIKNEIVRNSGYRYVEADKALRIDDNGNWIDGTLSDNIHPTINGAKLLYHRFLVDIPELTSKC